MSRVKNTSPLPPVLFTLFLFAFGSGIALFVLGRRSESRSTLLPSLPSPTPIPRSRDTIWSSPEGKMTLLMQTQELPREKMSYTLTVRFEESKKIVPIFKKTVNASVQYTIPFNSWAPGNKYFFIEEYNEEKKIYLVFTVDGKTSFDVNEYFSKKLPTLTLKEVTGWASPTLLIVNANGTDETPNGPSFWFDITKQSFTRLSSDFN